jgi:predicted outer membrane repeat protein
MKNTLLLIVFILFVTSNTIAGTIIVTSNADSGTGSLREAIASANPNDIIVFADNITTIYFSGVIILDKNITVSGNNTSNTIFQNAITGWTDTAHKKRYFEILENIEVTFNFLTLKDNTANCTGGAIKNNGNLSLNNCTFINNRALDSGGAILSYGGLIIDNCTFSNNYAPTLGGAIYSVSGSSLKVNNSVFNENYGNNAGAIYNGSGSICNINNATFINNSASYDSAISNYGDLQITNSILQENRSTQNATIGNKKNATIINCLFAQNNVNSTGDISLDPERGIVANSLSYSASSTTIINSTIVNNYGGHGVYVSRNNSLSIYNSIIFDNAKNDIHYILGNLAVQNTLIGTSNTDLSGNDNIIGEDPLFVTNGYSLQEGSPAIDIGSNAYLTAGLTKDLAGHPRIRNNTVDMGAYEFQYGSSTGIENASAITTKIYTRPHTIIVENAISPVSIYNPTGQLITQGTHTEFSVPTAGIYIVRVGNYVEKVIVP